MILSFYNVVAGWALGYFLKMTSGELGQGVDFAANFGSYVGNANQVLIHSGLFMVATAMIVLAGVQKGIERWTVILMPVLIVMMLGLSIYVLTLPGASKGLEFYLVPDWSKINGAVIFSAISQAFFSLGLGVGLLVTYGSYVSDKQNLVKSASIIAFMDTFIAFLAGILIFPLMFSQNVEPGAGPGLVFVTLPGVFASMGSQVGLIVGSAFFLLLCFAALTSTISVMEAPVIFLKDQFGISRTASVLIIGILTFALGVPSILSQGASPFFTEFISYGGQTKGFLDFINDVFSEMSLPLGGLIICLLVIFKWKYSNLIDELKLGNDQIENSFFAKYMKIVLMFVAPVLMILLLIDKCRTIFF